VEGEPRTFSARLEKTPPFLRARPNPRRLRIPQLGVDAEIVETGVDSGTMALTVPPTGDVVGWYRHGPAPGDPGSAVLAGHVDYNGSPGVFFELRHLEPGATFEVEDAEGATRQFTVERREQLPKESLPKANVFDDAGPPSVVLVTCGGEFDRRADAYQDNVLVFARPSS
jgi:sortase (surface protein transpeptidase)